VWFQLAMLKDRGIVKALVEKAVAAKCAVLILTVTCPIVAVMPRFFHSGLSFPPKITASRIVDFGRRPGWLLRTILGRRIAMHNFDGIADLDLYGIVGQLDPTANWKDVEWLRSIWPGKLIIKGICDADSAKAAMDCGVQAISVSNHGGNMLDGAASTISALPRVVDAVAGRGDVLLDGGVRSGQDVLKALASGAAACMLGRAPLYGLAANGESGVSRTLEIIRLELDVSMALTGLTDVRDASPAILWN
jgi:L-lactate dehydrogenase (cytochrome)